LWPFDCFRCHRMRPQRLSLGLFVAALFLGVVAQPAAAGPDVKSPKLDRGLTESLATGARTQKIIISVKPGYRDAIRNALKAHGAVIKSEHPLIDAIAAEVHAADVLDLANHDAVNYVSLDAKVSAGSATLGGRQLATATTRNTLTSIQTATAVSGLVRSTL